MAQDGRDVFAEVAAGALEGLARSAEDLAGRAQREAPVDEGTLRGSVNVVLIVNGTRFEGTGARVQAANAARLYAKAGQRVELDAEVSFNTVYAARQHEELDWQHPKGGGPKYLEGPLLANVARYQRIIALAAQRGAS
jgi:hypothetical protein